MRTRDLADVAALWARRDRIAVDAAERALALQLRSARYKLWVALDGGRVVGFARVARSSASGVLPRGWYLAGVVVRVDHRRRNIGTRLTALRLAWLRSRARTIYYVANARNRASQRLHERMGFALVASIHDTKLFRGGLGHLYALSMHG